MKPLKTISTKSQRRNFNSETREKLLEKGTVILGGNEKMVCGPYWGGGGRTIWIDRERRLRMFEKDTGNHIIFI